MGLPLSRLGSVRSSGSCNYVNFQEQAFDQLVLHPEKKELVRAVAHNASKFENNYIDEDYNEIRLVESSNKGAAHLSFPCPSPGRSKTLTAEVQPSSFAQPFKFLIRSQASSFIG